MPQPTHSSTLQPTRSSTPQPSRSSTPSLTRSPTPQPTLSSTPRPTVLLATADEFLLDDLLRLAAAAEVVPQVERDLLGLRRNWQTAVLVVVGDDLAEPLARTQPPRRPAVLLATRPPTNPARLPADAPDAYRLALAIGAEGAFVLPTDEGELSAKLSDALDGSTRTAITLAIVGGCGGAGATTLAAALAITAGRRGLRSILIDGDPLGGGIELVLGTEHYEGSRWPALLNAAGRVSASALRAALPSVDGLAVLSWDRSDVTALPPEAMRSVLGAAQRSSDLVVVDLPRRPDPAAEEAFVRATSTLVVVPRDVRSCAAAARLVAPLREVAHDLRVVAREPGLNGLSALDVADHLSLPLAAKLGFERDLATALDDGRFDPRPRSALGRAANEVLDLFGLYDLLAA
ncbi:septum site-determining protein Ssd [Kribbella sp. NPDC051718]|uniref:septum site-determining protein Ssd n=1 Tax=Kribbella sp. NPDC051718 TaxID=3155168 RepID=UPI003440D8C2